MKRFLLDVGLLIIFFAVMSFHFIPKVLHEVLGLIMLAAVAVHLKWNFRALRTISKMYLAIDILLLILMLAIEITGVCISNHLFNGLIDMKIQRNIFIHQLHVSLPFAMMILLGLHFGSNWQRFFQWLKSRVAINSIVAKIILIGLLIVGVVGVRMNQMLDRLLMKHIFGTPAAQLHPVLFILLLIGMLALFTAIGVLVNRLAKKF